MNLPDNLKCKSSEELEEWVLNALESDAPPHDTMVDIVEHVARTGDSERAKGMADLVMEALVEAEQQSPVLRLLKWHLASSEHDAKLRAFCESTVKKARKGRLGAAFAKAAGFGGDIPLKECLRRVELLHRLEPDVFCYDSTWGFGIVRRKDDFYEKVTIDFDNKRGHQMSFGYAAETLDLIGEDHLLVRKHQQPDELARQVKDEAGEVVRIALRSYGSMSAPRLNEVLVDAVVPEAGWKTFWDRARKELKSDPLVDLPTRRNDPIRLLATAKLSDEAWYSDLEKERDPETILKRIEELAGEKSRDELREEFLRVVSNRLAFVHYAARGSKPDLAARAILLAERMGEETDEAAVNTLGSSKPLLVALTEMPARDVPKLLAFLVERDKAPVLDVLLSLLPQMPFSVLNQAMGLLIDEDRAEDCARTLTAAIESHKAGVNVVYWICRNPETVQAWGLLRPGDLVTEILDAIELSASGERLRTQNQLRRLFDQPTWVKTIMDGLDGPQKESLLRRVMGSRGWDELERRSVMAKIIKTAPELAAVVAPSTESKTESRPTGRFTSWRSFRERQEQLRKLLTETIPANSREIGVALSYGDLRENFEYQAAKDQQRLLLQRKTEMETDLKEVKGTDFGSYPTDRAGIGTHVAIRFPEGEESVYFVLGEWDRDEALGIISNKSRLAEALDGHCAGDEVRVPKENGERAGVLSEVGELTDEVRAWVAG